MKKWITAFLLFIGLGTAIAQNENLKSLSVEEFEKAIKQPTGQLIDVRTPDEYKHGHIKGARNISVSDNSFDKQILTLKKRYLVAVYCRSGRRSKVAAHKLMEKGFTVVELNNGINDWLGQGKPVE